MYRPVCLCHVLKPIQTDTRLAVLMHWTETRTTTNTVRLASMLLPNSEVRVRGLRDNPMSTEGLIPAEGQAFFLYPSKDAVELTPEFLASFKKPYRLIVPDGTWSQARKVYNRTPELKGLPQIKLPLGKPSIYRLRKEPNEASMSTFEAISRALGILEGPEQGPRIQAEMENYFLMMVERVLWSRGALRAEDATTGIPAEALRASHIAGARGQALDLSSEEESESEEDSIEVD